MHHSSDQFGVFFLASSLAGLVRHDTKEKCVPAFSLRQHSQYVSDGPFLIGAVLNDELESELRLSALHQLQAALRLHVLDGATLRWKERREDL